MDVAQLVIAVLALLAGLPAAMRETRLVLANAASKKNLKFPFDSN